MGRIDSTIGTQAKLELDRTESVILTEGALKREELIARVRLVAIVGWGASGAMIDIGRGDARDFGRMALGFAYLLWSLNVLRGVRFALSQPRNASWLRATKIWSIALPLVDVLVNIGFQLLPMPHGPTSLPALHPERAGIIFALLIVFSVARQGWGHVAFATGLSTSAYFLCLYLPQRLYGVGPTPLMEGGVDLEVPVSSVYVTVGFVLMGILVASTQRLMREDFRGLRRLSNLRRFLPSQIAERIYRSGDTALAPVSREITVMFTDIRDFTSISEKMEPGQVLEFLDFYFGHMSQIVKGHDGVVSKFIGDGMLAFWGVPEHLERHAESALKAALDMRKKLEEINAGRVQAGQAPIQIGVGIHTGVVAAGLLGGGDSALCEYTVIGDAVNLASRIEGLNKKYGSDILATEATWLKVGGAFSGERLGEDHVKGREAAVVLYRITGRAP